MYVYIYIIYLLYMPEASMLVGFVQTHIVVFYMCIEDGIKTKSMDAENHPGEIAQKM